MENELKTPEILLPALRQYQHNDCSGLLAGFDYDETVKAVAMLNKDIMVLKGKLRFLKPFVEFSKEQIELPKGFSNMVDNIFCDLV